MIKGATDTLSEAPIRKEKPTLTPPPIKAKRQRKQKTGISALKKKKNLAKKAGVNRKVYTIDSGRSKFKCSLC